MSVDAKQEINTLSQLETIDNLTPKAKRPQTVADIPAQLPKPSSSTDGFFQSPPIILNQLLDDIALQRALTLFLPKHVEEDVVPEMAAFADKVLSKPVLDLVADAEKNLPRVESFDTWGRRRDELVTSEGWKKLSAIGAAEGMVSIGYENKYMQFSRAFQFLKYIVWTGSSAWVTCPSQMSDGVATFLRRQLSDPATCEPTRNALQSAYDRLISRGPDFITSGQWMTERQGGSDVSQTETLATYAPDLSKVDAESASEDGLPLGDWLVSGFKWFSSATDSSMMVFLARTPKGISTFMAPMRRTVPEGRTSALPLNDLKTELNGIEIQRLKNKLGTKALPTAELVLKNVRCHLVGQEGSGVRNIAMVLNIARVHNGITATGYWGRGLSIIRAFARVRKVGLKPLYTKTAFMRTLARMHVEYKANLLLGILVASLLGVVEQGEIAAYREATSSPASGPPALEPTAVVPNPENAHHLFRLLAPVLKGNVCKAAIAGLSETMECMGGVGYLESEDMQFNIARLLRDVQVTSIWEGTTDMMAGDVLRAAVFGSTSDEIRSAMDEWVSTLLSRAAASVEPEAQAVARLWKEWKKSIGMRTREQLEPRARELMRRLGDVIMGTLLILDASRDEDLIAIDTLRVWADEKLRSPMELRSEGDWQKEAARDMRVVFGTNQPGQEQFRARL